MSNPTAERFNPDFLTELFRDPLDAAYAAAAKRRAKRGPEPAWSRLSGRAAGLLSVVAVGFLFAVAYRHVVAAEPEITRTRAGLVSEVHAKQAETDDLQRRAEELRAAVDRERAEALAGGEAAQLRNLAAAAGLGRVSGDGLVIEVRDAPADTDPLTGKPRSDNPGRVRDRDLQGLVNGLWDAGAEAIAINGQRLSTTSTIRAAGAAILVDFKPVASPYAVSAIGPGDLDRRFERSRDGQLFRALARRYNMGVVVREQRDLTLPAATDPQLRYAHPLGRTPPEGGPSTGPSTVPSASGGR